MAQHSLAVLQITRALLPCADRRVFRHALLHDGAEAYIGDLTSAVKLLLRAGRSDSEFDLLEQRIQGAIEERFDAAIPSTSAGAKLVGRADMQACIYEMRLGGWAPGNDGYAHPHPSTIRAIEACSPFELSEDETVERFTREMTALGTESLPFYMNPGAKP